MGRGSEEDFLAFVFRCQGFVFLFQLLIIPGDKPLGRNYDPPGVNAGEQKHQQKDRCGKGRETLQDHRADFADIGGHNGKQRKDQGIIGFFDSNVIGITVIVILYAGF